jgi:hypothetical protein
MPQYQKLDLQFPLGGLDVSRGFKQQTASVAPLGAMYDPSFQQQKFETTRSGINVRGFDVIQNRFRGGTRPGLTKYISTQVNSTNALQALGYMQVTNFNPPSGSAQTSTAGLLNYLIAVAGGTIKFTWAGASAWSTPTNGSGALNSTNFVSMTMVNEKMYFCDGLAYKQWTPATGAVGTVATATATAGSLPASGANRCRLSTTWRNRWVLSGMKGDDQNIFMSAVGAPNNFNYAPASTTSTQAVAFNPAGANPSGFGQTFDVITALVPINDDNLFVGCAGSCFLLRGDPMQGGQCQCLEPGIGVQWNCWCKDEEGVLYFLSNKMGVYAFSQFDYPRLISQRIDPLLQQLASGANTTTMVWDHWMKGFHLFITNTASPTTATTHYFFEKRTGAWWQDTYPTNMNPLCCCQFDGNNPADRRVMIGGNDGYVRYSDFSGTTDDGTNIASSVLYGPIVSKFEQLMLADLRGELDTSSGAVTWTALGATTAQAAATAASEGTGAWAAGLNSLAYIRRAAKAHYIKLSSTAQWGIESMQAQVAALGARRERDSV